MGKRYQIMASGYPQKVTIYDSHRDKAVLKIPNKRGRKKLHNDEFIEYNSFQEVMNYMEIECARLNKEYEDDLLYLEIVEGYAFTLRQKIAKRSKRIFTKFVNYYKMIKERSKEIGGLIFTSILTVFLILVQKEIDKERNRRSTL